MRTRSLTRVQCLQHGQQQAGAESSCGVFRVAAVAHALLPAEVSRRYLHTARPVVKVRRRSARADCRGARGAGARRVS